MRFLHTADWHLGKTLCNASLLEDQALALEELLAMAKDTKAQALVVAGDLYDRAVPPKEAVALLDGFLTRIIRDLKVAVLVIAGNHDGPERLAFGRSFLGEGGLHVAGLAEAEPEPVVIGACAFHLMPYVDPTAARFALDEPELRSHQDVVAAQLARAWARHPGNRRMVAVAHAFVRGGLSSESELGLAVGGAGEVDADLFEPCDFAALGHLHAPQQAGHPHVRYAGSLLKYSASEAGHVKAATLVELGEHGPARTEPLPFSPRRDLRRVRGRFEDFLKGIPGSREDYLFLELTDEGPVLDAMARLRPLYPNVLGLSTAEALAALPGPEVERADPRKLDPEALFERFVQEVSGQSLSEEEWAVFREVAGPAFNEAREP